MLEAFEVGDHSTAKALVSNPPNHQPNIVQIVKN
jgi:hypothetical protein